MKRIVFLSLVLFALSMNASAFTFTPMVKQFVPKGKSRVQTFHLENKSEEKMAVQLKVFRRLSKKNGEEVRKPTEDISVFPEQLVIQPKQKRTVRVTWNGNDQVTQEQSYRLVAEQIPVDLKKKSPEKSGINFLMKYVASIYVRPEEVVATVKVKEKKPVTNGNQRLLSLKVENTGNVHQVLNRMWIDFKKGPKKHRLQGKDVKQLASVNLLPGDERKFHIPWPVNMPFGSSDIQIGFIKK